MKLDWAVYTKSINLGTSFNLKIMESGNCIESILSLSEKAFRSENKTGRKGKGGLKNTIKSRIVEKCLTKQGYYPFG